MWPRQSQAQLTMNPCLRKTCSPKLGLSSTHARFEIGLVAVFGLEGDGTALVVVGHKDPVAVGSAVEAELMALLEGDALDDVAAKGGPAVLHPIAELGHLTLFLVKARTPAFRADSRADLEQFGDEGETAQVGDVGPLELLEEPARIERRIEPAAHVAVQVIPQ